MTPSTTHLVGRVTVQDPRYLYASEARQVLNDALTTFWPEGARARYLITPAGFLQVEFPEDWEDYVGWDTTPEATSSLYDYAEPLVLELVSESLRSVVPSRADFLTVGVDMGTDDGPGEVHAELIAVYDTVSARVVRWLGKAYPTSRQEDVLVHDTDFATHCVQDGEARVLLLACHELTAFGGRSQKNILEGSPRHARSTEMLRAAREFAPTVILHHSHVTQRHRTWSQGWSGVQRLADPNVVWATSLRFLPGRLDTDLGDVLARTTGGDRVLEVILPAPEGKSE